MNEEIMDLFDYLPIHGEPVYTLAECVAAANQNEEPAEDDYEDMTDPVTEIKERFRKAVYLCDEKKLGVFRRAAELSEKKAIWEEDIFPYPFWLFADNNFVYLYEKNDNYYLVLPVELIEIFREVTADEGFTDINAKNLELISYAAALLELYGAYEIRHLANVWNQHHKDKITYEEAETFLSDLEYFGSDYYLEEDYVVHDCLDIEEFDELWEETCDMSYYMPTKSVIGECVAKRWDYDYKIPGEKAMDDFLAEHIKDERDLEDVQFEIRLSCERLLSPSEIKIILEDADAPLEDTAFAEKFERLYNTLRENTHIWELRGFTPHQYQNETGKPIPRFRLPKSKKHKK
ncbi:MAG: hypothetical protein FWD23_05915 [Oscillospiraceae bacterium]|nr:hypothetical protein [Oscillospiraceae bacterium]